MRFSWLAVSSLLLLLALATSISISSSSSPNSSATRGIATSPFEAAAFHLQQEYDRFAHDELSLAILSGASAVRTDLIARDRDQFQQRLYANIHDTVPADVACDRIKHCDKRNVCAIVCARGSVRTDAWAAQALRLQRKVAYQRNFCMAQLPGSHNSAINMADGYGVEDHVFEGYLKYISWFKSGLEVHTNDQLFSLTDQLQMGVRFIELDVHWFDNDLRIAHCGGFRSALLDGFVMALNEVAKLLGTDIQWDSETIGCKPSLSSIPASEQRPLAAALDEIADWVHAPANSDEFLVVFFDDETNLLKWKKVAKLLELITARFTSDEILLPSDLVHGSDWPVFQDLIDVGKRIVFLSGADYSPEGDHLLFVKETICDWREPPLPFEPFPTCRFHHPNTGPVDETRTIFRPETSEIVYGFLNADGAIGSNKNLLDELSLPPLVDCGVNLPSPDNITPTRMASGIWAVAPHAPLVQGQCVAIVRHGGDGGDDTVRTTWTSVDCNAPHLVPACVDPLRPHLWTLGGIVDNEAASTAVCALLTAGATASMTRHEARTQYHHAMQYGVPASGYEHRVIVELLAAAPPGVKGVWLNARALVDDVFFMNAKSSIATALPQALRKREPVLRRQFNSSDSDETPAMQPDHAVLAVE